VNWKKKAMCKICTLVDIAHEMALNKAEEEYEKFKAQQKGFEMEASLKELEEDIKELGKK
jgi:hypothetical protein